jgi:hypothetical protein
MRSLIGGALIVLLFGPSAHADIQGPPALFTTQPPRDTWQIDWMNLERSATVVAGRSLALPAASAQPPDNQPLHPVAIEHSDAYQTRAKIHKYASFATLPLFATELWLGQSVFNSSPGGAGSKKGAHIAVGSGIIGLFAVNTVTGAWNMFGGEGRQEKEGRRLRLVHGVLMMAANGGFLATWATAPHGDRFRAAPNVNNCRSTHRDIAVASISVGTAGYLLMLFGNH